MLFQPLADSSTVDATGLSTRKDRHRTGFALARNVLGFLTVALIGLHLVSRTGFVQLDGIGFTRKLKSSCHPQHKSINVGASGLPTHYTLPSGDKIPSVALGTAASAVNINC